MTTLHYIYQDYIHRPHIRQNSRLHRSHWCNGIPPGHSYNCIVRHILHPTSQDCILWKYEYIEYIPRNTHVVHALLCFVVVWYGLVFTDLVEIERALLWFGTDRFYLFPSGLLHWNWSHLTVASVTVEWSWSWFNIKMSSLQYRKSHCGDKTIVRSSYLHDGNSSTCKIVPLYWIRVQKAMSK